MSDDVEMTERASLPVACTLDAHDARARQERWALLTRQAAPTVERRDHAVVLQFPAAAGVYEELASLAAAESECCSFLTWEVAVQGDHPTLTIASPAGDQSTLESVAGLWTAI
jgi:hypothetical protein